MRIRDILDSRRVLLDLPGGSKPEILKILSTPVSQTHSSIDADHLLDVLVRREEISTTAIADGIAIPHGKMSLGNEVVCAFGRSFPGLDFQSVDGKPTHIFFLLVSPEDNAKLHLQWLAHLAGLLRNPEFRKALLTAETVEEVLAAIDAAEDSRETESSQESETSERTSKDP